MKEVTREEYKYIINILENAVFTNYFPNRSIIYDKEIINVEFVNIEYRDQYMFDFVRLVFEIPGWDYFVAIVQVDLHNRIGQCVIEHYDPDNNTTLQSVVQEFDNRLELFKNGGDK